MSVPASAATRRAALDVGDLDLSDVTIRLMPWWMSQALGSGIAAITLGSSIFVAHNWYDKVVGGHQPDLLLHELVHVGQWRREGKFGFLMQYVGDYVRNRLVGLDHEIAYRGIRFEAAAYDLLERRNRESS